MLLVFLALLAVRQTAQDPQRISESVTVTPPDAPRVPVTATATILTREALVQSPSFTLDQKLVATPGFSLFRRSSSRTANPTTQGVTLRGLSASGASRTLVLADDVPLNDPFGGWVYWNRVPSAAIDRVEVARGGTSDLFGSDALGGTIRVLTRQDGAGELRVEGGNQDTARVSAYGGIPSPVRVSSGVEWSTTEGYVPVEPAARGPVDTPAGSGYLSALVNASMPIRAVRLDAGGSFLDEDRANGTPLQNNSTRGGAAHAGLSGEVAGGFWRARVHLFDQEYDQTFSAVFAARSAERLTNAQHVETQAGRVDVSWSRGGTRVSWLFDGGVRRVEADLIDGGELTRALQQTGTAGAQAVWHAAPSLTVSAGIRGEVWTSEDRDDAASQSSAAFLAPRASVSWRANASTTLRGTIFNAFRAPTVNERYRGFRVGDITTLPNPQLNPEDAWGGEAALTIVRPLVTLRAVGFVTWQDGAIYSRTLPTSAPGTLRMRDNGDARASGLELEADAPLRSWVHGWASVALTRSTFTSGELEGRRLPQVPGAQVAAGARVMRGRWLASVEARYWGRQFDDDRNSFELGSGFAANALASMRFQHAQLFAAIENIFDAEIDAGRTPLRTLAQPRTWTVGVRVSAR